MEASVQLEQKEKIKILDSVRAFATIAVFLFHVGYLFPYIESIFNWQRIIYFSGTVGVSIFFVLSGFLLFYQLYKKYEPLDKKRLKEYVKKRLLRILPLYYFSILFITLVLKYDIFLTAEGMKSILYNMLFIRKIKDASGGGGTIPINPVYWSLIVEMHFYFLLPIFYRFFYKFKKMWIFLIPLVIGLIYRIFLVTVVENPSMQFLRFTIANFDFFALGMLGAYLYIHRVKWIAYLGKTSIQILCLCVFALFFRLYNFDFAPTTAYIFMPTLLGLITIVTILSFLGNAETIVSKVLTIRPILFIAKISFSIFIWHAIIFGYVDNLDISNGIKISLNILITLIVSTISYYIIEAPFLKFKKRKIFRAKADLPQRQVW